MAKNHGIVNTTSMSCWDVDALNICGIASADMDNGTLVTLKNITKDTTGNITGYQYTVEAAAVNAKNVWLVATPEVGYDLDMQIHDDIRYFYNVAGKPMSVKGFIPGIDCAEFDAVAFGGTLPTNADIGKYYPIAAGGKFGTGAASAPAAGAYFRFEGLHTITCGSDEVPTAVMRCMSQG